MTEAIDERREASDAKEKAEITSGAVIAGSLGKVSMALGDTSAADISRTGVELRSMLSPQDQRNIGSSMSTTALNRLARLTVSFGKEGNIVKARLSELGGQPGGLGAFFAIAAIAEACVGDFDAFNEATSAVQGLLSAAAISRPGVGRFPHPAESLARAAVLYGNDLPSFISVAGSMAELARRADTAACWFVCEYACTGFGAEFTNVAILNRLVTFISEMGPKHDFINLSSIPKTSAGDVERMFALLAREKAKEDVLEKIVSQQSAVAISEREPLAQKLRFLLEIPDRALQLDAQETKILDESLEVVPETAIALANAKNAQVRASAVTKIDDLGVLEMIANADKNEIVCSSLRNANLGFAKSVAEALHSRSDELSRLDAEGAISVDETGGYSRADKNLAETFLSPRDQQVLRICKLIEANIPDEY